MTAIPVECLRCGSRHHLLRSRHSTIDEGECPRCGYLGWAPVPAPSARPPALRTTPAQRPSAISGVQRRPFGGRSLRGFT